MFPDVLSGTTCQFCSNTGDSPQVGMLSAHQVGLVGREVELTRLTRLLTQSDEQAGVILVGPSGVGKTRLATEALAQTAANRSVIRVMANHPDPALPFQSSAAAARTRSNASLVDLPAWEIPNVLGRIGSARRVPMLYVDDAHLLEPATAALLFELAVQRRTRLLLTTNIDEQAPARITALWKDEHLHRLDVRPLNATATQRLARAWLGEQITDRAARRLAQLSDGNPLLLRELVRAATQEQLLTRSPAGLTLPHQVPLSVPLYDLIKLRIGQLTPGERNALEQVVLAEPVPLPLLERMVTDSVLLELEAKDLIRVEPTSSKYPEDAMVRLFHPLVGYVIRHDMPTLRRRAHLRAWTRTYTEAAGSMAEIMRVVGWRLDAGELVSEEELLRAGKEAANGHDLQAAARFTSAAWQQHATVRAAAAHALSLIAMADFDGAATVLDAAERLHQAPSELLIAARARWHVLQGRFKDASHVIDQLTDPQHTLHAGMCAYLQGHYDLALSLCSRLTGKSGSPHQLEATIFQMAALLHAGRPADALTLYETIRDVGDNGTAFHADSLDEVYAGALADLGRLEEAADVLSRAYDRAITEQRVRLDAQRALALGVVLLERGRPKQALGLFAFHSAYPVGWQLWQDRAQLWTALATATLGRPNETHLPVPSPSPSFAYHCIAQAWMMFLRGDRGQAESLLLQAAETSRMHGGHADVAAVAHELARLGMADQAAPFCEIPLQGRYLQARRDYARAIAAGDSRLLRRVAEAFAEAGAELYAAEAYAELARLYRLGSQYRAATAATLRAQALAARCEGASTPPLLLLQSTDPLTLREREIVLLVAQGLSDKEIAERLTVSVRTVGNHLYRIYRKTGVSSRRELQRTTGYSMSPPRPE
ncbi:LuxR C-terminal-related transcriptional regulator [Streptomyces sp. NPDC052013]|uniref:helix-turn-helix transcriptional regulator n=1 Tax=Streptomyces sp. NPDC052013 TaxID=3365679 RepID=UPI0037CE0F5D